MFIEILFKILLFKGGVLIYVEHCIYIYIYIYIYALNQTKILAKVNYERIRSFLKVQFSPLTNY